MTIVTGPVLESLYKTARSQSSRNPVWQFWQVALQHAFHGIEDVSVIFQAGNEYNDTTYLADVVVVQFDHTQSRETTETADEPWQTPLLCFVVLEGARTDQTEHHALDALQRAFKRSQTLAQHRKHWAITTSGLSFRLWRFDADHDQLVLERGTTAAEMDPSPSTSPSYIDATSDEAAVLFRIVEEVMAGGNKRPLP